MRVTDPRPRCTAYARPSWSASERQEICDQIVHGLAICFAIGPRDAHALALAIDDVLTCSGAVTDRRVSGLTDVVQRHRDVAACAQVALPGRVPFPAAVLLVVGDAPSK